METMLMVNIIGLWVIGLLNLLLCFRLFSKLNANAGHTTISTMSTIQNTVTSLVLDEVAPEFNVPTFSGKPAQLSDYRGKPFFMLFISPGCKPCMEILETLPKLASRVRQHGMELLLISNSTRDDSGPLSFLSQDFPVLLAPKDEHPLFNDYKVSATPYFYLISADGTVRARGFGHDLHSYVPAALDESELGANMSKYQPASPEGGQLIPA